LGFSEFEELVIRSETMLRVTISIDEAGPVIRLEGRLAGSAIQEAERGWQETCAEHPDQPVRVDLRAVTFINEEGKLFLKKAYQAGADFLTAGCLTRAYVEEIMQSGRTD
jgi:anti-anti-sigma regulatory factor